MCDPLTATGIALSVGSTLYKSQGAKKNTSRMVRARNDAAAAEDGRQRAYQDEANDVFNRTLPKFERGAQDVGVEQARQKREEKLTDAASGDGADEYQAPTAGSAPTVVKSEIARRISDALTQGTKRARTQAALSAYGDNMFGNKVALGRSRGELAQVSDFASKSAGLLPYEMRAAAQNASRAPSIVGDLLGLAGSGATMAGMAGVGPSFGDLFGAEVITDANPLDFYGKGVRMA